MAKSETKYPHKIDTKVEDTTLNDLLSFTAKSERSKSDAIRFALKAGLKILNCDHEFAPCDSHGDFIKTGGYRGPVYAKCVKCGCSPSFETFSIEI